jgi:hypothetical protein
MITVEIKRLAECSSTKHRKFLCMVPECHAGPNVFKKYAYETTKRTAEELPGDVGKA